MTKVNILKILGAVFIIVGSVCFILNVFQSYKLQIFLGNPIGELIPSIYGMLAASTLNPFIWIGVIFFWVSEKKDKFNSSSYWLKIIKIYGVLTLVIFLITSYFIINPNVYKNFKGENKSVYASSGSMNNLSSDEKLVILQRFREITKEVMQDENMPTPEIHQEFWELLYKSGYSDNDVQRLKETMTGDSTIYMKYFYEDALVSLSEGRPYKSKQREDYEKKLLQTGGITEFRIKDNENMIAKIAEGQPVKIDVQNQIIFTKEMIEPILANLDKVGQRIDKLFTK